MPDAGGIFVADPALLGGRRRKFLYELKAVAQAHFAQDHSVVGIDFLKTGHGSLTRRCWLKKTFCFRVRREQLRCRRPAPAPSSLRRYCRRSIPPAMPE